MTNIDPVMEPIFTKIIPCPGVGILKMIPCSAARPRTEKYMSTPSPRDAFAPQRRGVLECGCNSTRIWALAKGITCMTEFFKNSEPFLHEFHEVS